MDNIVLMNSGSTNINKNFRTVKPGINLKTLESIINYSTFKHLKKIYSNGFVHIFGIINDNEFKKIDIGNYVWFCHNNIYHSLTKVIHKTIDEKLAEHLWGTKKIYKNIIFVQEVIKTNFTRSNVQKKVGLSEIYNSFASHPLNNIKSKKLIETFKLDELLGDDKYTWDDTDKILGKEKIEVKTIEEYIDTVKKIIDLKSTSKLFVYRGEKKDYGSTSCMPNIFREIQYVDNDDYEKSLYHDMYSKGIVSRQSSLETAIEAQHGGFPSRLLDVSYNALIALYFATEYKEWESVTENAIVTIFNIDEIYIPGAHNSEELFEEIISHNSKIRKLDISAFNHKLIDHMNKNDRIKAQQGAFILFQGREYRAIPEVMFKKIEIKKDYIKKIHNELDKLFGINVGKIYPEPHNQIDLMKARNKFINSKQYSLENEFEIALKMFKRINEDRYRKINDYIIEVLKINLKNNEKMTTSTENKIVNKINEFEESILIFKFDYKKSLLKLRELLIESVDFSEIEECIESLRNRYNNIVEDLYNKILRPTSKLNIECSDLKILKILKAEIFYQKNLKTESLLNIQYSNKSMIFIDKNKNV